MKALDKFIPTNSIETLKKEHTVHLEAVKMLNVLLSYGFEIEEIQLQRLLRRLKKHLITMKNHEIKLSHSLQEQTKIKKECQLDLKAINEQLHDMRRSKTDVQS